jgi:hypothetical protein
VSSTFLKGEYIVVEEVTVKFDGYDKHKEIYGGYNDFPPNWTEITEKEFLKHFFCWTIQKIESRQMREKGSNNFISARLFFMSKDPHVAIVDESFSYKNEKGMIAFDHNARFFKFQDCEHEFKELNYDECKKRGITHHGKCWHVTECEKCGKMFSFDSSG